MTQVVQLYEQSAAAYSIGIYLWRWECWMKAGFGAHGWRGAGSP